jgi:MYXO-CTERM domain-containing protein
VQVFGVRAGVLPGKVGPNAMRKLLALVVLAVLTITLPARAATGGACPTTAQYLAVSDAATQPSLAVTPLVTLASLGVNQCFYVASDGTASDSNSGTTEAKPWLHAPHMPNCLSGSACDISLMPGQALIIKGGSHYHYFTGSPQVGLPAGWPTGANGYAWNIPESGSPGAEIYIGVDQGWFIGSTWTRPIFDNDNPTFLPSAPSPAQTTAGWASTAVPSCAFNQGNLDDIVLNGSTYVQLDNFEFTGVCWNDIPTNGSSGTNEHTYIKHFGVGSQATSWRRITNMYWHGWSHTAFNASCTTATRTGTCGSATAVIGTTQNLAQGTLLAFDVTDGSDSDDLSFSTNGGDGYDYEESVMRHAGPVNILGNCHQLHDNLFELINNSGVPGSHTDMWFCVAEYPLNNFYYNNLIRDVGTEYNQASLSTVVWFGGVQPGQTCGGTCTDYVFNNVLHDINAQGNYMNVGGVDTGIGNGGLMAFEIYNNTVEMLPIVGGGGPTSPVWENGNASSAVINDANNHYITNATPGCGSAYVATTNVNAGITSCSGDVFQTVAQANAEGYTSANDFGLSATAKATLGTGANETSKAAMFGPAFLKSTTNGCAYDATHHKVNCPAITANPRPASGPWDIGAYQHCDGGCTEPDGGSASDGGSSSDGDASTSNDGGDRNGGSNATSGTSSGCSCRAAGQPAGSPSGLAFLALLAQGGFVLRRRRSRMPART